MKRILMLTLVFVCLAGLLSAQSVNRGAFNIMGAGARAMGMGGAFTAIADDATAASWNPAGLAQLTKPEASLVYDSYSGEVNYQDEGTYDFADSGLSYTYEDVDDTADLDYGALSFASFLYPIEMGNRFLVTQFSYSRLSNFPDVDNPYTYIYQWSDAEGNPLYTETDMWNVQSNFSGGIDAYTVSLATDLSPKFHLGLSLNYMQADVKLIRDYAVTWETSEGEFGSDAWQEDASYDFSDLYFDFGFLWKISEQFSIGGVYHSGFDADADYEFGDVTYPATITWPSGWGVGLAWRPTSAVTVAADYSERSWSEGKVDWEDPQWEDTTFPYLYYDRQFDTSSMRFGFEYALVLASNAVIPFRAGYFLEEQIASYFWGGEQPDSTGYTLGTGFAYKNFQFDVAYVHSEADTEEQAGEWDGWDPDLGNYNATYYGSFDSTIDRFMVSAIVRF
jgi:long-subunit fatty acid transport protein